MEELTRWLGGMPGWLLMFWVTWALVAIALLVVTANTRTRGDLKSQIADASAMTHARLAELHIDLENVNNLHRSELDKMRRDLRNANTASNANLQQLARELRELREQLKPQSGKDEGNPS